MEKITFSDSRQEVLQKYREGQTELLYTASLFIKVFVNEDKIDNLKEVVYRVFSFPRFDLMISLKFLN